ncbi:phenylalanine--tRNA ligase subunit alpha [Candidatus Pantoea edessiphila]|uniref:Phenylalanine--tRNA ligase alpha subunit n=1 Tax=Candidatus Pantoea edessiphila TaxID=2044610 RepID=A0A2P5SYS7_9GAMM|nr:phenylalanine--tRNA ligase subunit alpha [Candidatus Pantoea edessiphila]MBK4775381.1 phenylalanine--tRNA ligase subunit alpha [Pantoea sp. Edef]PPI87488.1 phenylalanine--tRNA ligase subunit alpha [Candidatus Pantoea edessiphila]
MSKLSDLIEEAIMTIENSKDISSLELARIKYLGKKGHIKKLIDSLNDTPSSKRAIEGEILNKAKNRIISHINDHKKKLESISLNLRLSQDQIDVSLPGRRIGNGGLHPITITMNHIEKFFTSLGFATISGFEIEDQYHNFDALNIPDYHPARTDHDTFWLNEFALLRTQTSGVQIRIMKNQKPPIRIISSGRVYRNDYDQSHTPMFHQVEGLIIDDDISFANLKQTIYDFLYNFFGECTKIRFRPSYFPFTEPSAEFDVMNNNNKWLEVLGCGLIHPKILDNMSINSEIYSGFAFGIGVERLAMLRYDIKDLRSFFENDLRFLKQFRSL